ncbi:MAG: cell division protein FtsZ [Candidatus Wildermuthbacteria bacterium RIFCSPLOWO2_02_FULL_47_9c]|uniref:Cell division protein FtsZ n=2 Tax=Parcubacteria group TaxID=1794811 RepID=A0A837IKL0_9BACT|nr:MAG: Cell division protein FtsZ [Candidatus Yanofskybacteria bacterium GW2011_GWC1_48_11]KKW04055.1 MAG: Cell division protein FtsZ [Parcubacteria group bacterium GW2011_GWB1_49_12]KKW08844.1 MAG: Cell division protein FtsZ [Parcubacteria group bacterium GW2011_GWA1_49_26]KKW13841.1 MAG: Cell division protein FtsZ [Parcubacteria group bacterium GW2011_GWA2_50_10]OHA61767.1 MAG: cell division protein FtsZ [Candidatus Wildermuthbacteria bacterium GWA1_49_26]OHA65594.1 MAG: cell division prote
MQKKTIIKVVGIGGGGGNAIDRMMQCKIKGIDLIAVNTDVQDLKKIRALQKIRIGQEATRGLGAGMNPELGKRAALESKAELIEALKGADMVFLTAGLGGGTGGGAIPVLAQIARSQGALTIAVVTRPFSFEGSWRSKLAERALTELKGKVDTLLVIPNDQILKLADQDMSVLAAFWKADEILRQAVQGISDLIVLPGIINVDFADLRSIMKNSGRAVFGMGQAKGEKRMEQALGAALHSPLLNMSIKGARGILFQVAGADDVSLHEIQEAAQQIKDEISPQAKIIFGAVQDKNLKLGEVRFTIIATGFGE